MAQQRATLRSQLTLWALATFAASGLSCSEGEVPQPPPVEIPQQIPGQQIPGQQIPGQQIPGQQIPGQQIPGQQIPGQQIPGQQAQPYAGVPLSQIEQMIGAGQQAQAKVLLLQLTATAPQGWQAMRREGNQISFAAWNDQELAAFSATPQAQGAQVQRVEPSYSLAHFLLAYIAVEERDLEQALTQIGRSLELEPDHPRAHNEAGLILNTLRRPQEALPHFQQAMTARPWAARGDIARAQRGAGVVLVELGRLDEAEAALQQSLVNEPNNPNALSELEHIRRLRSGETTPQNSKIQINRGTP